MVGAVKDLPLRYLGVTASIAGAFLGALSKCCFKLSHNIQAAEDEADAEAEKALAQERTMLLPKGEEPAQRFKREADPWAWGTSWNVFYLGVAIAPTEVAFPDPSRLLLPPDTRECSPADCVAVVTGSTGPCSFLPRTAEAHLPARWGSGRLFQSLPKQLHAGGEARMARLPHLCRDRDGGLSGGRSARG